MIKEALQYVVGLGRAEEHNIYDDKYSDKPLYRIDPYIPKAEAIVMHTLTSLVDYIKAHIDDMTEKMIIEVRSPEEVALCSQLDMNRDRETMAVVYARIPSFPFDSFMDKEKFCINLQSKFIDDPETDRALMLTFA